MGAGVNGAGVNGASWNGASWNGASLKRAGRGPLSKVAGIRPDARHS